MHHVGPLVEPALVAAVHALVAAVATLVHAVAGIRPAVAVSILNRTNCVMDITKAKFDQI